ncbi:MAG: CDP-6-deoxy-delta-3,4-glucoseen reductase, partial [Gammaproteobacteria bacterium]|nr:CDP-6-deoxy-delta-3,4-glucoseen reductase [Gammaproteobacteria bacterium]
LKLRARAVQSVADVQIKTLPCRIERLVSLAPDVLQVWLRLPAVERLPFQAGQYLDVLLEGGRRRSFSIASPPHDSELLELHVRQVAGGDFSARLFARTGDALGVGSLLRIEGPVGQFVYRAGTGPLIMVAGGTGFAPLKSILRHLLENRIRRRVHFYWGARTAADLYQDELARDWAEHHAAQLTYHAVLSEGEPQAAHQRRGWVHEALLTDHPDLGPFEVYAAGPPALIEVLRRETPGHGLPPERLYFDSFDYAPDLRR